MKLQNTQLRDQLEEAKKKMLMSGTIPQEQVPGVEKMFDDIVDDEMGRKVLQTIHESDGWQSNPESRDNNSERQIELSQPEGPVMQTHQHYIENIKKKAGKETANDIAVDVEALIAAVRQEAGQNGLVQLQQAIREDLLEVGRKVDEKIEKFSSALGRPQEVVVAIGWRTLEFLGRMAIVMGGVVFTAWLLKKVLESTTAAPMLEAVPG